MLQSSFTTMTTRPLPRWILATRGAPSLSLTAAGVVPLGGSGATPPYRLCLLGQPAVLGSLGAITEGTVRQRHPLATLALLARAGERGCSRERLVGMLWPETDERRARHSLSGVLHTLKRDLGDSVIIHIGDAVHLARSAVAVDTSQFEETIRLGELESAVTLYTGRFLEGFNLPGSQPFDEWMEAERTHLADCYAGVLDRLAAAATAAGDLPAAAGWWRQRLEHDVFCSHAAEALMDTLAAGGDRAAAIQVMEEHLTRLRSEGVEPGAALEHAVRRLRAAGTSRHLATRTPAPPTERTTTAPGDGALTPERPASLLVAVTQPAQEIAARRPRRPRRAIGVTITGVLVAAAGSVALARLPKPVTPDENLVAVSSFGLVGPMIDPFWADGFAGLVAIKLQAAAGMHARVLTSSDGTTQRRRSAGVTGREVGAGFVLVGTLAVEGPDSVALAAELYDAEDSSAIGRFSLLAPGDRLDGLATRLVREVLARIDTVRAARSR